MTTNHVSAFYGKVRIPTIGHARAVALVKSAATKTGGDTIVGISGVDSPLQRSTRDALIFALFGNDISIIRDTPETKSLITFLSWLSKKYDSITLVCGSDRYKEYNTLFAKYNGSDLFKFKFWKVLQAGGSRSSGKPPSGSSYQTLIKSVSASMLEKLAANKNFDLFKQYYPGISPTLIKKAFNELSANSINENIKHKEFIPMLNSFAEFAANHLELQSPPKIYLRKDSEGTSFGGYYPNSKEIHISTKNRHPMDVFRTLAHELVHHKQNEEGRITDPSKEGSDGSEIENEANSIAGIIMRRFGKANPKNFKLAGLVESNKPKDREEGTNSLVTIYSKGTPGQVKKKKDRTEGGENLDNTGMNVGVGPTYGGSEKPYPYGVYGYTESVQKWIRTPKVISRYSRNYGKEFLHKLYEDAQIIDKRLRKIQESADKGIFDNSPPIASQGKDDSNMQYDDGGFPIRSLPKINKRNSKRRG